MEIVIQLNSKKKAYVLTEKKHSSCSLYNCGSAIQRLLFKGFQFQLKWRKFVTSLFYKYWEKYYYNVFVSLSCLRC